MKNKNYTPIKKKNNQTENITIFGFWLYIMSDSILFASLFAVYTILKNNIADGPSGKDIFDLLYVFIETLSLLISSITYSMVLMNNDNKTLTNTWMFITFMFGLLFFTMEMYEFHHLINQGYGPWKSAFLSGFFTLLGTHASHVISGLIWIVVMIFQINHFGLTEKNKTRLQCLSIFWHFLDIIWICVFTTVYLIGIL